MKKKHLNKLIKKLLKLGFVSAVVMIVGVVLAVGFAVFRGRNRRRFREDYRSWTHPRFERGRKWESRGYR